MWEQRLQEHLLSESLKDSATLHPQKYGSNKGRKKREIGEEGPPIKEKVKTDLELADKKRKKFAELDEF